MRTWELAQAFRVAGGFKDAGSSWARQVAELVEGCAEVLGKRGLEGDGTATVGMVERHAEGVERETGDERALVFMTITAIVTFELRQEYGTRATVTWIDRQGMAKGGQVNANLVQAAGERSAFQQRVAFEALKHPVARKGRLALARIGLDELAIAVDAERDVDLVFLMVVG